MVEKNPLSHLEALLVIGIGGFAGSNLRYFLDLAIPSSLVATLTVNVIGCCALGFLLYEGHYTGIVGDQSLLVLTTGFISSFTTYSTFVVDAVTTEPTLAMAYVFASYALGFLAVLVGRQLAQWFAKYNGADPATLDAAGGE